MKKSILDEIEPLIHILNSVENRLKTWNIPHQAGSRVKSSLSDEQSYLTICKTAFSDQKVFNRFRSCREYQAILEHVNSRVGKEYLSILKTRGISELKIKSLLDGKIGTPSRFWYRGIGMASPTELRYLKIASDLQEIFGDLDDFKIVEVGIGFGGQCAIISRSSAVKSYDLVDLKEVLSLTSLYLTKSKIPTKINLCRELLPSIPEYDLFISNYALSELKIEYQEHYIENFVKRSKRGYVIYNHITPKDFKTLTAEEFADRIQNSIIINEKPITHPGNKLIIWGQ
jgi:putative sugar O-methyltransferase